MINVIKGPYDDRIMAYIIDSGKMGQLDRHKCLRNIYHLLTYIIHRYVHIKVRMIIFQIILPMRIDLVLTLYLHLRHPVLLDIKLFYSCHVHT